MTDLALATELTGEQREYLTWVKSSGDNLLRVLNDILDFSKIDAGQLSLETIPLSLAQQLDAVVALHSIAAEGKGLRLYWQAATPLPDNLAGDPVRIQQILNNLVSNAIKFTERGEVTIHASCDAEPDAQGKRKVRFAVSDTGIGIPADKLDSIFDPFAQAEDSTTRRFGGTGLGLTIVARLAELMHGSIKVSSTPGQGTRFDVELTLATASKQADRTVTLDQTEAQRRLFGKRVLLVEDTPVNQKIAEKLLTRYGCEVTTANNGIEALEAATRQSFDVILMDMQMPEMDGLEATRRLRIMNVQGKVACLPIIALTANAMAEDREECLAAGMDDFIAKPFRADNVISALLRHV